MEIFFAVIFGLGALYLLLIIFTGFGDALDFDIGGGDLSGTDSLGEATGISLNVIASFMVAFGAIGLSGSLAGWHLGVILVLATVIGYIVARLLSRFIRFIYAQQSDTVESSQRLVGMMARITINTSAGKTGEAIIEGDQHITKYAVREINDSPLERGDRVQVVSLNGRLLNVKKKHPYTDTATDKPQPLSDLFDTEHP
jgi:membrane protein implicated in regulation of membrane protease activity